MGSWYSGLHLAASSGRPFYSFAPLPIAHCPLPIAYLLETSGAIAPSVTYY